MLSYYYQIQMQIKVCDTAYGDFVIYGGRESSLA